MQIALCDDEAAALDLLSTLIDTHCRMESLSVQLDRFPSGEAILASSKVYDIVFMDIYLTGISGMEAARELAHRTHCQLVFTTISHDHAIEAYGVRAAHYLVKPLTQEAVAEAITRCLTTQRQKLAKIIKVKSGPDMVPLAMEGIIYAEVFDKVSIIHTEKNDIQTYTPLDTILEQLDGNFLKVQRSFVVNMHFVESFLADRVVLRSGLEIVLSRNNRSELKQKYQQFLFRLTRRNGR